MQLTKKQIASINDAFSKWDTINSPGAAVAVVHEGDVIFKEGYGSAQLEYKIPITPTTIFHVASVSKQFTAMAIALLAHEGKISLDDDVRMYVPEVPEFDETITIRHLVHHTSGLRDQWELLVLAGWRMDDVITHEDIMKMTQYQEDLNFTPGEQHLYCNTGYTLMAEIVERVSGKPFTDFTNERIFKPLRMNDTHFHLDHEMIVPNRAYSYQPAEEGYKKSVLSYANVGATSLFTTVLDLAKWSDNFYSNTVGNEAVMDTMHQRFTLNNGEEIDYAFGQTIGELGEQVTVSHSGADAGFRSHLLRLPELEAAVIVLSNLSIFRPDLLAHRVAEIVFEDELGLQDESVNTKSREKEFAVNRDELKRYVGNYLLTPGRVVEIELKDQRLILNTSGMPEIELKPIASNEFQLVGALEGITKAELDEEGNVISLDLSALRKGMKAAKIKDITIENIAEYTGIYYSSELGNSYKVVANNGKLVVKHRRKSDVDLIATDTDQFEPASYAYGWGSTKFTRNEQDDINGFVLTGGRVRNLRFTKVE